MGDEGGYQISRSVRLRSNATAYFNRTPAVAPTSNQKGTFSFWFKRGLVSSATEQWLFAGGSNSMGAYIPTTDRLGFEYFGGLYLITTQVFRDPSSWYHLTFAVDTTQATAANRVKLYINGVQVTSFVTEQYPSQNSTFNWMANAQICYINQIAIGGRYFDGYITEFNYIDGQQLTPTSFGEFNAVTGVWQPKKYAGTYGTNGFYLNFSDNSAATAAAIGKDYSGNGNNWTPNNISVTAGATYDSMLDVPTPYADGGNGRGNYAVLNVIAGLGNGTYSDANLAYLNGVSATWKSGVASMGATSGKYYFEYTITAVSNSSNFWLGVAGSTYTGFASYLGRTSDSWSFQWNGTSSVKTNNDTSTTVSTAGSISVNNVIQVAIDLGTGSIWWGRNNTWVQGDPSAGTGASFTNLTGTILPAFAVYSNGGDKIAANFGQRPFTYTPPTGFKALNTQNLPASTIDNGAAYMAATTYTGNGGTLAVSNAVNGVSFQPDLVWVKGRSVAYNNYLEDSVRGVGKDLSSNATDAEATYNLLSSFNSNGFTAFTNGTYLASNQNGTTYVGWQWKAGGAAVTNTAGSISSQVSANVSAGFSVVTYTGTGANATVGHGLGVAPRMVIIKSRNTVYDWGVYHASIGNTAGIWLNLTNASFTSATWWNNTSPTSTVFTVSTGATINTNTTTYVAYCFAEVAGYSKFGSYTGNGSANGPFVYLGFRPRFVMVKCSSAVENWYMLDTARDTYNPENDYLIANGSGAEANYNSLFDFTANGFKIRGAAAANNSNGATYIYACFAENPFKNSLAR